MRCTLLAIFDVVQSPTIEIFRDQCFENFFPKYFRHCLSSILTKNCEKQRIMRNKELWEKSAKKAEYLTHFAVLLINFTDCFTDII
jgi:hypothetical protein